MIDEFIILGEKGNEAVQVNFSINDQGIMPVSRNISHISFK